MAILFCGLIQLPAIGCRRDAPPLPAPALPQVSGTIVVQGLRSPVRVVRDRAGVPHVYADNDADLFFGQGFVQAQDRLFQMDLWRRASQGRLAEILGANFIDRDAMTRRIQYRGGIDAEWASYGPDARAIADAFVRGVNAWVSIAREHLPEEFAQVRWPPSYWRADDLLNRTDAFLDSGGALEDIRRTNMPGVVADAVRLVGTAPFLAGAAVPEEMTRTRTATHVETTGGLLSVGEARQVLAAPASRYIVHLVAPGWNVIGATSPWLPGVAVGHNGRIAWGMTPLDVDTEEVLIEPASAAVAGPPELMRVKGRPQLLPFTRDATASGLVIASDREHQRVFVLRWRGFEPGMAAGLGALAIDRAGDALLFGEAAKRWRMPALRFVFADVDGHLGRVDSLPTGAHLAEGPQGPGLRNTDGARAVAASDRALFPHLIHRFDIGPVARPADDTPLRLMLDPRAWDRSRAMVSPGQSGAPASAHYADMAPRWTSGELFNLWFTEGAVRANAEATLTLSPAQPR